MTVQFRPEPRRPFQNIGQALSQGISQGFERQRSTDILDNIINQALQKDGDLISNLLTGLQGSGATLPEALETVQRFAPIIQGEQTRQTQLDKLNLESARNQAQSQELNRISNLDTAQEVPENIPVVSADASLADPLLNALQGTKQGPQLVSPERQEVLDRNQINQEALSKPRVSAAIQKRNSLENEISTIDQQVREIEGSQFINEKLKDSRIKRLQANQERKRKELEKFTGTSKEERKFLDQIRQDADKARNALPKISRIRELIPSVSKEQPFTVGGNIINPFKASDRARVERELLTPEEQEFSGLMFDIIRDQFPTLPRIKTEFETILNRNLSILQTEEGNNRLTDNLELAMNLAIRKDELRQQFLDAGIPENQVDNLVQNRISKEEQGLIERINSDLGGGSTGKLTQKQIDKRLFG
ncbi:MAG: hypothetical protein ABFQ95_01115 [Pseudomonadota bacterium]